MPKQMTKEMRSITVLIPKALVEKIDALAMEEERSRSKMIEILLRNKLNSKVNQTMNSSFNEETVVPFRVD
jgi:metal-responsive CopG/Arc/MetJ family transcriptional regulator